MSAVKNTKSAIAFAVLKHRPEVIALFKKNGVMVSSGWSDHELITGILAAIRENERFKEDLKALLIKVTTENKTLFTGEGMFKFTGENMYALFTGDAMFNMPAFDTSKWHGSVDVKKLRVDGPITDDEYDAAYYGGYASTPTTTTPKKPGVLSGVLSSQNLSNLFNTGVNTLSSVLVNKGNKDLANTALEIEREKTQQAALLAQASAAGAGAGGAKPGMSTGAKVGIGIAIAVGVGLLTWVAVVLIKRSKTAKAAKATA